MSIYSLGLYEKSMPHALTLADKLAYTLSSGFDFLEVSIDETDEKQARLYWRKAERREVSNHIADIGIGIGSMCLSAHRKYPFGSQDVATRRKSLEIIERAIELACDWGIRIIQLAGYDVYYEPSSDKTRKFFLTNLLKAVDMASKAGVTLAFETMETPFMDTVAKAMYYVREVESPWLQIYPDIGNLTNAAKLYGHNVCNDLAKGQGHIAAIHLKETKPGIYRDVPFGAGHVNFVKIIQAAQEQGIHRFVGEFWDNGDYLPQIKHANQFLRGVLDSAKTL